MSATTIPSFERADLAWRMNPLKVSVVKDRGRRMVPYLVEAMLIPTALFYVFFITFELKWTVVAALGWTYAATGRRIVTDRSIPGLLIMRPVATAAVFALSVCIGRPLVARFAAERLRRTYRSSSVTVSRCEPMAFGGRRAHHLAEQRTTYVAMCVGR